MTLNKLKKIVEDGKSSTVGNIVQVTDCVARNSLDQLQCISIKIPMSFFHNNQIIQKFTYKHKNPGVVKATLGRNSHAGGIKRPDLKFYYRVLCPTLLPGTVLNTMTTSNLGEETISLVYTSKSQCVVEWRQRRILSRNLKTETEAGRMVESSSQACFCWLAQLHLFETPDHLLRL